MKTIILLISTIILSTCSNSKNNIDIATLFEKELKIISVNDNDISDLELTILFQNKDKSISGFAGCNRFFGSYAIEGNTIGFSKVGATKMYCQDAEINKNERLYLSLLSEVKSYKFSKNETIQLLDKADKVLITLHI